MMRLTSTQLKQDVRDTGMAIVLAIMVLLPFHAVFTTWLGSNFGHLDLFRIWKELLMIPLGLCAAYILITEKNIRNTVMRAPITWLILAYSFLTIGTGLLALNGAVNQEALLYGLIINLRFVLFFLFVWVISLRTTWLQKHWREIVIVPALLVIAFGILQWLVLPGDFLRHFGYGPDTIPAIQTVDAQADFRRIQSTLRGANPLGAYLVLIATVLAAMVVTRRRERKMGVYLLGASLVVLLLTFSRSAYIGAAVSIGLLGWWLLPSGLWRKRLLVVGVSVVLVFSAAIYVLRDNDFVQNTFFHSSENSTSATSSNANRASALTDGLQDIASEPLGRGVGTAGPASARNTEPPRIAENYYIQIAQEVGLIGLGLFVAINVAIAQLLWRRRSDTLALILLASLAGLTVVNLISHAWADDTISLLWWGMAGICVSAGILNKEQTNEKKKTKAKKVTTT